MIEAFQTAEGVIEVDPPKQDITNFNGLIKLTLDTPIEEQLPMPAVIGEEMAY